MRKQSQFGQLVNADRPTPRSLPDLHEQPDSSCGQCAVDGPGVPSDHSLAKTMKMVTRCSGLLAAIIGEPGRLAPQLFSASPATRNSRVDANFWRRPSDNFASESLRPSLQVEDGAILSFSVPTPV